MGPDADGLFHLNRRGRAVTFDVTLPCGRPDHYVAKRRDQRVRWIFLLPQSAVLPVPGRAIYGESSGAGYVTGTLPPLPGSAWSFAQPVANMTITMRSAATLDDVVAADEADG
jgi:hypothetical protein